jgi:hypothetical protein
MPPERSNWIGLVCWGLIIDGMHGLYATMKVLGTDVFKHSMTQFPYPAAAAYAFVFGGYILMVFCGACMYERQGWARYLYLIGVLPLFAQRWMEHHFAQQELLAHPPKVPEPDWEKYLLILQVILYLVSIYILFMYRARRYYNPPLYVDE